MATIFGFHVLRCCRLVIGLENKKKIRILGQATIGQLKSLPRLVCYDMFNVNVRYVASRISSSQTMLSRIGYSRERFII